MSTAPESTTTKHSMTTVNTSNSINLERDEHDHLKYRRGANEYCTGEHDHTKHLMTTVKTLKSIALTVMIMITLRIISVVKTQTKTDSTTILTVFGSADV